MNPTHYTNYFKEWIKVIDIKSLEETLNLISKELVNYNIYPKQEDTFKAFLECPFNKLEVVILGQDPYPQKDVATGIAFANNKNTKNISPSLQVILDSINTYYTDLISGEFDTDLLYLCKQGVLLLNSALTVRANCPGSHSMLWRGFIGNLLYNLSTYNSKIVFVLLGSKAQSFKSYINKSSKVIECNHPSYYARTNSLMPNIWKQIDNICIENNLPLIFWK